MRLTTCPLAAPHRETAGEGYAGPIEWSTARFLPAPPHLGELQHHRDQCELAAIYSSSCLHQLGNITPGQRQSELEIPRQRLMLPASGVRSADEFHHHRFQPEEQVPALPVHIPPPPQPVLASHMLGYERTALCEVDFTEPKLLPTMLPAKAGMS